MRNSRPDRTVREWMVFLIPFDEKREPGQGEQTRETEREGQSEKGPVGVSWVAACSRMRITGVSCMGMKLMG